MRSTASSTHPTDVRFQPGWSQRVKLTVVSWSVQATQATAKPSATSSRPPILARLDRPRLRSWLTLTQSSNAPPPAAPAMASMTSTPVRVNTRPPRTWAAKYPTTAATTMATPPIVGVPALVTWPSGTPWGCGGAAGGAHSAGAFREGALDRRAGDRAVVEGDGAVADHLGGLVSLACDEHDVPRPRLVHSRRDGPGAVGVDRDRRGGGHARVHVVDDGQRILRARVVGCEHDPVGEADGHLPHDRALGGVAVPAATEDNREAPIMAHQFARGAPRLFEGVGLLRVVHG